MKIIKKQVQVEWQSVISRNGDILKRLYTGVSGTTTSFLNALGPKALGHLNPGCAYNTSA